ncbi:DJ-1/PfpI family protein [Lysobacter korlensis]|uniref:DJ-1/PfpI family protein n=1 Tax=Lysobacter korlensis TaxID=553636 RepID=A0ABV6RWD9_9GAMM
MLSVAAGVLVGAIVVGSVIGLGVLQTMAQSFATRAAADLQLPPADARPDSGDKLQVAVAFGVGGSVVADALAPYGVFAKSEKFNVFTVSSDGAPVGLSGGLTAVPDYSIADLRSNRAPEPDIVVVPAFADPAGAANAPVRKWIQEAHSAGATILGVCAGAQVLAAAGVLEGRTATSHFAELGSLSSNHPETTWVRGHRYVDDGRITTTAGVTSGIAASLHLVERFAGRAEAERIGQEVGAHEWQDFDDTTIPVNTIGPEDYPYLLGAAVPWFKPTYAVAITEASDEIDIAAAFEVYSGSSFATKLVPISTAPVVETHNGLTLLAATPADLEAHPDRVVVPGEDTPSLAPLKVWIEANSIPVFVSKHPSASESSFAPFLRDLADTTDAATARTLAKYIEYPVRDVTASAAFPGRLVVLTAAIVLLGAGAGIATWMIANPRTRLRKALRRARRGYETGERS